MGACQPKSLSEAPNFAQDIPLRVRHNTFMQRLSVLGLLAVISCQMTTIEDGDSMFRRGNYPQALEIYSHLESDTPSSELQGRIDRTRYFMLEQGVRDLLHLGRPEDALEILDHLEGVAPSDRMEIVDNLRGRTLRQIGRRHYDLGFDYYEATNVEAAAQEYTLCLSWDPTNEGARINLAKCEEWLRTRERIGDDYYFVAMDHLRADEDLRARTAFMHASSLLGEDSRAEERLQNLTATLAEQSREKSLLYISAGLTGQAWVAAQDALYLAPQDERNQELAEHLAAVVKSDSYLLAADVASRGGETSAADDFLARTRALGVEEHSSRISSIAERNQDRKHDERYARGRAYELDSQMVHARGVYNEILAEEGGINWNDIEQRLEAIGDRLAEAERLMNAGLAAHQAGDESTYATRLQEVLRLSVDYPGALTAYRALLAAQN
jgi:hypothetical protein